jgi:hypothetical protein
MQFGYLVQVFLGHTFDAGVRRVDSQGHLGLVEPVVERFGVNT